MADEITTDVHDGFWGDWGLKIIAPIGYRVTALKTRLEGPQGGDPADDTSLNGVSMRVATFDNTATSEIMVEPGLWGSWGGWVEIPADHYICGLEVRMEDPQGDFGDDTAMNGIRIWHCVRGGDPLNDKQMLEVEDGNWGSWRSPILLPRNYYLAGLQTRLEGPQGGQLDSDDDTALNGIKMISRPLPTDWSFGVTEYVKEKLRGKRKLSPKAAPSKR